MDFMSAVISGGIVLVINVAIFAFGYGKLSTKVEHNKDEIVRFEKDCLNRRRNCRENSTRIDTKIFTKLDELKDMVHQNFLDLNIKITELQRKE